MTSTDATTGLADRPAILGGSPSITLDQSAALRWPRVDERDEQAVLEVLRSGHLSIHPVVQQLEDDYRSWLGVTHALAHNNGTGGLHAAMHACDLSPGDEVLVPSATWWASVMPIVHAGGVPVFVETDEQRLGLDPDDVKAKITGRTKAMVIVHLFGMPSRTDELLAIAREHGLKVIEDASHAHGATDRGRPIGTLGDVAVFSMQANKLCPSAEGGMLVTNDDELHERAIRYGHYERLLPMKGSPNRRFAATGFGMKFRMSPLSAAFARSQLARLPERNARRTANCRWLAQRLEPLGFETFLPPEGVERTYFEFIVRYRRAEGDPSVDALIAALQAEGAQVTAPRYPLLHQQPMFTEGTWATIARLDPAPRTYDPTDLPRTIRGNTELLRLPAFPGDPSADGPETTEADRALLGQYARAFERVMAHRSELPATDEPDPGASGKGERVA